MHFPADGYSVLRHSPNGASVALCPHTREDNDVLLSTLKHITSTNHYFEEENFQAGRPFMRLYSRMYVYSSNIYVPESHQQYQLL